MFSDCSLLFRVKPDKREKRPCSLSGKRDSDAGDTDRESIMSPDIPDDFIPIHCSSGSKEDIKSEPRDSSSPLSVSTPLDHGDPHSLKEDDGQHGIKQEPLLPVSPSHIPDVYSHISQFFQAQESISKFYAQAEQHQKLLSCAYNPAQTDFSSYVPNPYYETGAVYPPAYGSSESYSPDLTTQASAYAGNFSLSSASSLSPGTAPNAPYSYPAPSY